MREGKDVEAKQRFTTVLHTAEELRIPYLPQSEVMRLAYSEIWNRYQRVVGNQPFQDLLTKGVTDEFWQRNLAAFGRGRRH